MCLCLLIVYTRMHASYTILGFSEQMHPMIHDSLSDDIILVYMILYLMTSDIKLDESYMVYVYKIT